MKELTKTCIICPAGCTLKITVQDDGTVAVTGNKCPRGKRYAEQEMTDPRRTVTATAATDSAEFPRLPVKTAAPVPKAAIPAVLAEIGQLTVKLPVEIGTVLIADAGKTGTAVVATRTMPPREK